MGVDWNLATVAFLPQALEQRRRFSIEEVGIVIYSAHIEPRIGYTSMLAPYNTVGQT